MKKIALLAGLLSGCVYNVSPPRFALDHPGNPDAAAAPLPVLARSLQSYDPAAGPDPEAPEMDHGAMGHGSMNGMDHGSMDHGKELSDGHHLGKQKQAHVEGAGGHSKRHALHHWEAPPEAAKRKNPVKADAASIARGKALFEKYCATCHGKEGRGDGPAASALDPKPVDLVAMAGHHSDGDYAWKISNGRGAMPPWKGVLDEKQIWDVVNYVQDLGGAKSKTKHHDHSKHEH
ncbi:MAG TPA: c-type cytochrome [Burkholderiales bacterium]|nr:c-type cytochrome [Burkholderiales bacterium]